MKKIGIIGAMDLEVDALKVKLSDVKITTKARMEFYEGTLNGTNVVVVSCGIGKVNEALCDLFGVTHIVNTGVAGSLDAKLDIGDFVISRDAIYHDFTCQALNPAYIVGQVPGLAVRAFPADEQLMAYAFTAADVACPGHAHLGTVASGDQFVCSKDVKRKIVENTGALCTEMEGAAIAHGAYLNNIPFLVVRAISDKADGSAEMDYPTFERAAALPSAKLVEALVAKI